MLRDTFAALDELPEACTRLRRNLPSGAHAALSKLEHAIRSQLNPAEACNTVPGHDPQNC
jgi:hypothetical protein